jgi:hypothetical protein
MFVDDRFKAIERVAARKRREAQSRALGVDPTLEKAQEVVSAVAGAIAGRFAADGFRYAPSGRRRLTRKVGDWSQEIHLDGGGANSPGRTIHLKVFAFVKNAAFKRWQKKKPSALFHPGRLPRDVAVVSERVMPGWPRAEWKLTDPQKRPAAIDAAEQHIREKIMPVLGMFADREALRAHLTTDTRPDHFQRLVRLDLAIDLLMCCFDAEHAARAVDFFLAAHPSEEFATRLAFAFAKARAGHVPENLANAEIIAVAITRYELPVTHPLLRKLRTAELPPYDPLAEWARSRSGAGAGVGVGAGAGHADIVRLLQAAGYRVDPI